VLPRRAPLLLLTRYVALTASGNSKRRDADIRSSLVALWGYDSCRRFECAAGVLSSRAGVLEASDNFFARDICLIAYSSFNAFE
jgi:hypothetical protein